jgi:hypothetical protein
MVSKALHLGLVDEPTLHLRISNIVLAWIWKGLILLLYLLIAKSARISASTSRLTNWIGVAALVATSANLLFFSVQANAGRPTSTRSLP